MGKSEKKKNELLRQWLLPQAAERKKPITNLSTDSVRKATD